MGLTENSSQITMPKGSGLTKPMKLSADLADIVGKKEASRAECIKELWAYLKKNNLQDPANKQFFTPDKKMAKVFGTDRIRAFGMAKFLSAHLSQEVTARNTQHLEPTKKNPAPKGDQREKKEENTIITILQLQFYPSYVPNLYIMYYIIFGPYHRQNYSVSFISEIMYLLYICRYVRGIKL